MYPRVKRLAANEGWIRADRSAVPSPSPRCEHAAGRPRRGPSPACWSARRTEPRPHGAQLRGRIAYPVALGRAARGPERHLHGVSHCLSTRIRRVGPRPFGRLVAPRGLKAPWWPTSSP